MSRDSEPGDRFLCPRPDDHAIAALAHRQHGVVSLDQLRTLGLGARGAQLRCRRGLLHRVHRGVYAVGHDRLSLDGRRMAAVLACGPDAVLSHRSAGAVWGIRPHESSWIEVTTPRRGRSEPPGVRLHCVRRLDRADVTVMRGLPVTTVHRTLLDLADVLTDDALEGAVHEAEVLRLLDVGGIEQALSRGNGRRGATRLRKAVAAPSPGPTRSELERRFLHLCRHGGLPLPLLNAAVQTEHQLYTVDALFPDAMLVVELDGEHVHHTRRAFHHDRRRDTALAAAGYLVIRLTWERLTGEPEAVLTQLRRILALRGTQQRVS